MPRTVTVKFEDGSSHVYNGVPDDATPDQVEQRAANDFAGKRLVGIDGGKGAPPAETAPPLATAGAAGVGRGGRAPTPETLAAMRDNGLTRTVEGLRDDPVGTLQAGAAGFNRGVANLAGLPVDTVANVVDLGGMAYGAVRQAMTGRPGDEFYTPIDRSRQFGSGEFNANALDAGSRLFGGGQVTQNPAPNNPAARLAYGVGQAVPGAATGRQLAVNAGGGVASTAVAEAGGDPAAQAAAGLLGNRAAAGRTSAAPPTIPEGPATVASRQAEQANTAQAHDAAAKAHMAAVKSAPDEATRTAHVVAAREHWNKSDALAGKGAAPAKAAATAPASKLEGALTDYNDGETTTGRDLLEQVERLIDDGDAPESLRAAVDEFKADIADDFTVQGGRGDLDAAESKFVSAVEAAAKPGAKSSSAGEPPRASEQTKNGETVRVYHGTNAAEFNEFKPRFAPGFGPGIYLTDTPEGAGQFGKRIVAADVTLKNPYRGKGIPDDVLEGTKAYAAVKEKWPDVRDAWQEDSNFVGAALRELGYDGIIARGSNDVQGMEVVAFSPSQVRIVKDKPAAAPMTASGEPRTLPKEKPAAPPRELTATSQPRATPYTDLEGSTARKPPRFVDTTPVADDGAKLGMGEQARRKDILRRVGLGQLRNSAVQGDAKAASTDFQMSKLDSPQGQHMARVLTAEHEAVANYADKIAAETGGTRGIGGTENLQRGQNIVAPLDGIKDFYDNRIKALYKIADERSKGKPFDTAKTREVVGDESQFLGTLEGEALLRGVKARMKALKITDADGTPQRTTVQQAERMKQFLNDSWTPRTSRLVKQLKEAIDDDVAKSAGEDVYARARSMRAERARILDDPQGIAKILDAEGPQGINRAVAVERIGDVITTLPVAQFSHIVKTLHNAPAELRDAAQAALAEIKSQFANKVAEIGNKTATQWNAKGVSKYLNDNSARLRVLFSPEELRKFADLNDAGHILRFDSSYPGAAVQAENLKRAAVVDYGATAAGTAIGSLFGPLGGVAGAGLGKLAGGKLSKSMNERAGLKAAQKRTTDLRNEPENALGKPRPPTPGNSLQRGN